MDFKIKHPFDYDRVKLLSKEQQLEYLKLICEVADGKKIPNSIITRDNFDYLLTVGIAEVEIKSKNYWEEGNHFLSETDYEKLSAKYPKELIDSTIESFVNWKNASKAKRTNIYLTLNNWISKNDKFVLSQDQVTFIEKSFSAYVMSTEVVSSSKVLYYKKMETLFSKGYTIEQLRDYLKKSINKEMLNSSPDYRKKIENVISNFETWIKMKGV